MRKNVLKAGVPKFKNRTTKFKFQLLQKNEFLRRIHIKIV
ncbi:hypothetical protein LEP1GSC036_0034 [Leptospira weilii str. 2006001853]|uniref:Uncharacterized protein n=1 Tax=Leptospira weilii str. 2006001853 TaxID=1001589 RepID=A0A828YUV7_9LEPT|nr:hypothetical protein LEP1GSC036_0034 [Leptospira weilii str. 2006001853]